MEDNKFTPVELDDDFSLEEQYKPIELDESMVRQNMQTVQNVPVTARGSSRPIADISRVGVLVMSAFLAIDMFLPYITITVLDVQDTTCLFPGLYSLEFIVIAIVMAVCALTRKEKAMIIDALASIVVCIRASGRAGYSSLAVGISSKNSGLNVGIKYEFGYYGMIIGAVGLALFALLYIMSTDIQKPWRD